MTGLLFLAGLAIYLVVGWLVVEWLGARGHAQMVRNVQAIKLRSRTPGGSAPTPDRCAPHTLSGPAGVEPPSSISAAPPAPHTPVGAGHHPCPASTGLHRRRVVIHG